MPTARTPIDLQTNNRQRRLTMPRLIVSSAAGIGVAFSLAACASGATTSDDSSAASTAPSESMAADTSNSSSYKAGNYTEEGTYQSPGGTEHIKVTLTIDKTGTITKVNVTPESTDAQGKQFQTMFAGGISGDVVGKSVSSVKVSKVSGSSLTSTGFNEAVSTIASKAKNT